MQFNNPPRKIKNNMTTLHLKKSIDRSPSRLAFFLIPLVLACFTLSPKLQAQDQNTRLGFEALDSNTMGDKNTALGYRAMRDNRAGSENTATGFQALSNNITGVLNTATGASALRNNTIGTDNTAMGEGALNRNDTGSRNTANGEKALFSNTTGNGNTAIGYIALKRNPTGTGNTAIGTLALSNIDVGNNNIALGALAGTALDSGDHNIYIGNQGVVAESKTIRIGQGMHMATYIAGIRGATVSGMAVFVNDKGQLGTVPSSQRFKDEIRSMDQVSEAILALKPVTFRYKKELTPGGIPQFGLVAEDVEKVNPDLVVRDDEGKPYSVRYEAVNAMLLNEFLKEHRKNEEQGRDIQEQKATIALQQKQIDALTAGLQKVSAQLEASKPAPQVVNNP